MLASTKKITSLGTGAQSTAGTTVLSSIKKTARLTGKISNLPVLKAKKNTYPRIYFAADCGPSSTMAVGTFDPTRISSKNTVKNAAEYLKFIKKEMKIQRAK